MNTSSWQGNTLLALCDGNPLVTSRFPSQRINCMELLFLNQCWYVLLTHICFTQPQQVKGTQVSNPPKYETVPITDFFTFLFLPLRWAAKGPQLCDLTNSCSWPTWPWPSCPGALALPRSPRCPVCHTCFVTQRCNNNFSHAVKP